jgi:hypothetical protein
MLCRRDDPRSAFEAQIRAKRGTGSALTADADEFDAARSSRLKAERTRFGRIAGGDVKRKRRH